MPKDSRTPPDVADHLERVVALYRETFSFLGLSDPQFRLDRFLTSLLDFVARQNEIAGAILREEANYDPERLRVQATYAVPAQEADQLTDVRKSSSMARLIAEEGKPIYVPDLATGERVEEKQRKFLIRRGFRSAVYIPIIQAERLRAFLVLFKTEASAFDAAQLEFLEHFLSDALPAVYFFADRLYEVHSLFLNEIRDATSILARVSTSFHAAKGYLEDPPQMLAEISERLSAASGISESDMSFVQEGFGIIDEDLEQLRRLLSEAFDVDRGYRLIPSLRSFALRTVQPLERKYEDIVIELDEEKDEHISLVTREADLRHLIFNVVLNAVQAVRDAYGRGLRDSLSGLVRIRIKRAESPDKVLFEVEDNGVGMTEEVRVRALERGFSTRTKSGGSGLGLSLSAKYLEQEGGQLKIESKPNEGTIVRAVIPKRSRMLDRDPSHEHREGTDDE